MPPAFVSPGALKGEALMESIRNNVLALEDELHEALAETGWKPWASSNHVNREAYKKELVDAWHFFMNLLLAQNITWDEFSAAYELKHARNLERQREGYTGVEGKCPVCKRSFDDLKAVNPRFAVVTVLDHDYCSIRCSLKDGNLPVGC
jgi:hypothetical protein